VAELGQIFHSTQSNISKHLTRLRLTGIVNDKREGQFIYYYLTRTNGKFHQDLISCITKALSGLDICKQDLEQLKEIKKGAKS